MRNRRHRVLVVLCCALVAGALVSSAVRAQEPVDAQYDNGVKQVNGNLSEHPVTGSDLLALAAIGGGLLTVGFVLRRVST